MEKSRLIVIMGNRFAHVLTSMTSRYAHIDFVAKLSVIARYPFLRVIRV